MTQIKTTIHTTETSVDNVNWEQGDPVEVTITQKTFEQDPVTVVEIDGKEYDIHTMKDILSHMEYIEDVNK